MTEILALAALWLGLALAYFYEYPVGFYVTTVAFLAYLAARGGRALAVLAARSPRPAPPGAEELA